MSRAPNLKSCTPAQFRAAVEGLCQTLPRPVTITIPRLRAKLPRLSRREAQEGLAWLGREGLLVARATWWRAGEEDPLAAASLCARGPEPDVDDQAVRVLDYLDTLAESGQRRLRPGGTRSSIARAIGMGHNAVERTLADLVDLGEVLTAWTPSHMHAGRWCYYRSKQVGFEALGPGWFDAPEGGRESAGLGDEDEPEDDDGPDLEDAES